jgi:hypothetical protein
MTAPTHCLLEPGRAIGSVASAQQRLREGPRLLRDLAVGLEASALGRIALAQAADAAAHLTAAVVTRRRVHRQHLAAVVA